MTKKTKQNFKIGSGYVNETQELKTENMILKAEIQRLKEQHKTDSRVNFELKRELRRLDRSEKQDLEYRIDSLESENQEMKEKLELLKDGADFLAICGLPTNLFNKTVGTLGLVTQNEQKANIMHQMLSKVKEPILINKDNNK